MPGSFHPLVVHLPIGFLLLGALFVGLIKWRPQNKNLRPAVPLILLLGALSALLSCGTGWLLAANGDYDEAVLFQHRWLGLATALGALGLYFTKKHYTLVAWMALSVLLIVTGHLGGTLTHGEGFLSFRKTENSDESKLTYTGELSEARVYADLVQPILAKKCTSCHGESKKKGGLRLDTPEWIQKGGKNGLAITKEHPEESELLLRIQLPLADEDHMPPKGKPQLSLSELALLETWIAQGAAFEGRVKDQPQPELFKAAADPKAKLAAKPLLPEEPVVAADPVLLQALSKEGIVIVPVYAGSNYLSLAFHSLPDAGDSLVARLLPLAPQIVSLKLSGTKITDSSVKVIAGLTQLRRLSLDHTAVSDVRPLAQLSHLQYLNLAYTHIGPESLPALSSLSSLSQLFLYQTRVTASSVEALRKQLPQLETDTGAYHVPTFASDTVIFKKNK